MENNVTLLYVSTVGPQYNKRFGTGKCLL